MLPVLFYFFLSLLLIFFPCFFFLLLEILALRRRVCFHILFPDECYILYKKKDYHHHVHDTRRYIVTLIWLFASPYTIIGKQQIKWNTKNKKKTKMGGQVKLKLPEFQHCLFTKQRLTQEFTEEKFNRQQRFGSSVRSWSDGQTNLNILARSTLKTASRIYIFFKYVQ